MYCSIDSKASQSVIKPLWTGWMSCPDVLVSSVETVPLVLITQAGVTCTAMCMSCPGGLQCPRPLTLSATHQTRLAVAIPREAGSKTSSKHAAAAVKHHYVFHPSESYGIYEISRRSKKSGGIDGQQRTDPRHISACKILIRLYGCSLTTRTYFFFLCSQPA
jgi:hypothetical protein